MAVIITDHESEYSFGWREKTARQRRNGVIALTIFGMAVIFIIGLAKAEIW